MEARLRTTMMVIMRREKIREAIQEEGGRKEAEVHPLLSEV